jgi:hypothetical protein
MTATRQLWRSGLRVRALAPLRSNITAAGPAAPHSPAAHPCGCRVDIDSAASTIRPPSAPRAARPLRSSKQEHHCPAITLRKLKPPASGYSVFPKTSIPERHLQTRPGPRGYVDKCHRAATSHSGPRSGSIDDLLGRHSGPRRMGRLEYSSPWRYVTDVRLDPLLPIEQLITSSFSTRGSSSGLS